MGDAGDRSTCTRTELEKFYPESHMAVINIESLQMPTLIITVDPQCCRCITKLQNILCCIQDRGEFVIDKISYEKDKVLVSGPFDAAKLYCKLWCKAGKIIKGIEVAKPPPKPDPKSDPPKPKPEPPKCTLVPWPYPYPYPRQTPLTWPPCDCGCPTQHCECHSKQPPPLPLPAPTPPKPPTCVCPTWPSCHCCSYPPTPMPYQALLVCEESPPYGACAVM